MAKSKQVGERAAATQSIAAEGANAESQRFATDRISNWETNRLIGVKEQGVSLQRRPDYLGLVATFASAG